MTRPWLQHKGSGRGTIEGWHREPNSEVMTRPVCCARCAGDGHAHHAADGRRAQGDAARAGHAADADHVRRPPSRLASLASLASFGPRCPRDKSLAAAHPPQQQLPASSSSGVRGAGCVLRPIAGRWAAAPRAWTSLPPTTRATPKWWPARSSWTRTTPPCWCVVGALHGLLACDACAFPLL